MPVHDSLLLRIVDAIDRGHNVELVGRRMSGRTALAIRVTEHYRSLNRAVLFLPGPRIPDEAAAGYDVIVVDGWDRLDEGSWRGALRAQQQTGAPLVVTRTLGWAAPSPLAALDRPTVTFEMPELDGLTLGELVRTRLGFALDSNAMEQLATISSGSPGVALAVVTAAVDAGQLEVTGGHATLVGALAVPREVTNERSGVQLPSPVPAQRAVSGEPPVATGAGRGESTALTAQEQVVVRHAAEGMSNKEIAAALVLSVRTVEAHLLRAMRKLGVSSRAHLQGKLDPH